MADLTPDEQAELKRLETKFLSSDEESELAALEAKYGLGSTFDGGSSQGSFAEGLFNLSGFAGDVGQNIGDLFSTVGAIGGRAVDKLADARDYLLPTALNPYLSGADRYNATPQGKLYPVSDIDNPPPSSGLDTYRAFQAAPHETTKELARVIPGLPSAYQEIAELVNPELAIPEYDKGVLARQALSDIGTGGFLYGGAKGFSAAGQAAKASRAAKTALVQDPAVQTALGIAERRNLLSGRAAGDVKELRRGTLAKPLEAEAIEAIQREAFDPELLGRKISGELGAPGGETAFDISLGIDTNKAVPKLLARDFFKDADTLPKIKEKIKIRFEDSALEKDLVLKDIEQAIGRDVIPRTFEGAKRAYLNPSTTGRVSVKDPAIREAALKLEKEIQRLVKTELSEDLAAALHRTRNSILGDFVREGDVNASISLRDATEKIQSLNESRRLLAKEFDSGNQARSARGDTLRTAADFEGSIRATRQMQRAIDDAIENSVNQLNAAKGTNFNPQFLREFNEEHGALKSLQRTIKDFERKTNQGFATKAPTRISQNPGQSPPSTTFIPLSVREAISTAAGKVLGTEPPNKALIDYLRNLNREGFAAENIQDLLSLRDNPVDLSALPQTPKPNRIRGFAQGAVSGGRNLLGNTLGGLRDAFTTGPGLAGSLATSFLFPRVSVELEARQQELISAIAQKPGTTPGELEDLAAIFAPNVNPRQRAIGLAQVAQNHPELFEQTEFTSLMDGVIHDPEELSLARDQVSDDLRLGRISAEEAAKKHTAISRRTTNLNVPNSRRQAPTVLASAGLNTTAY